MNKYLPLLLILFSSCAGIINTGSKSNLGGAEIIRTLDSLDVKEREALIFKFVEENAVPAFLFDYSEIKINEVLDGKNIELKYYVSPDYFSLGNDSDYFLTPMTPVLARKVADYYDCILPTRKMVNQIFSAAQIKFYPQPIKPSPKMITVKIFSDHNDSIKIQRHKYFNNYSLSLLAAGHKKDVIISNYIYSNLKPNVPKPVVIYGWHKPDGSPIQPLYNGHGQNYTDYSHGIRLIKNKCLINGKEVLFKDILRDTLLSRLISDEGVILRGNYSKGE